jgi:death-on-curing protein
MAHAFVDGNKRIAFAAADAFLRLNGQRLTWSDDDAYQVVMAVARGEMTKDALTEHLREAIEPRQS